jgi:ribonuclease P protein component
MDLSPRKIQRLRLSGEFRSVREKGTAFTGKWLVLSIWKGDGALVGSGPKFGVITSKKVGGAVVRNLVRRRIRHIHRAHHADVMDGVWCVIIARFRASFASFEELDAEWCKLARRAGILKSCAPLSAS